MSVAAAGAKPTLGSGGMVEMAVAEVHMSISKVGELKRSRTAKVTFKPQDHSNLLVLAPLDKPHDSLLIIIHCTIFHHYQEITYIQQVVKVI